MILLVVAASTARASEPESIIVRYAGDGPHAVEACGVALQQLGSHEPYTRDRSSSLDSLHERFDVRRVRALVGGGARAEAGLTGRRRELRRRIERAWGRAQLRAPTRPRSGRASGPGGVPAARPIHGMPAPMARSADALAHVYRIELGPGVSAREAARAYAADPHVAWAQIDFARALDQFAGPPPPWPDPFVSSSGSWGQPYADLWGFHRIGAGEAHSTSRGEGVVVAVVDSGLDLDHPDIARNVFVHPGEDLNGNGIADPEEWNGVDDDGNGYIDDLVGFDFANSIDANGDGDYVDADDVNDADPFDDRGHGSHVAGIIGAVANNGEGIAGVAPGARIMPLKGFKADGENSDALLWRAVLYAALNGAQVVNNSWSCALPCPRNPLAEEVVELVHGLGVTIVTSAGNRSRDAAVFRPENMWQTLTVGSSTVDDEPSTSFTNQGFVVDVLAPGGGPPIVAGVNVARRNILSLRSSGGNPNDEVFEVSDDYLRMSGTSMSAPQVAGVAALLYAQRPGIGPDAVRRIIRRTALDLGDPGHDWETGAGRLDAARAVAEPEAPDWVVRVTSPRVATWIDPREGRLEVRGTARGPDFARVEVSVGEGVRPESWQLIVSSTTPVDAGVLAEWRLEPEIAGAWVIRVEAVSRQGVRAREFIPVSFDRLSPQILSSEGPPAERPAIHGRRVVWQSRRGETEDRFGRLDYDLFEGAFGRELERRLVGGPGDQRDVDVSASRRGRTYAWLTQLDLDAPPRARACHVARGQDRTCLGVDLGGDRGQTQPPVAMRDGVYWLDPLPGQSSRFDLTTCRFDTPGGVCAPTPTGLAPERRGFVEGDGRGTLSWNALDDGLRIATCEVDGAGRCDEVRLPAGERAFTRPAASRGLVAWVAARFFGDRPLRACVPDEVGACEPIDILPHAEDDRVRVSGDLVVWDGHVDDQASDVFFCEFDRLRGRCPVQRLTSEGSKQDQSDVDGRRIVWVDERLGPGRIAATELPSWRPIGPRRVHAGRWLQFTAWLDPSDHGVARVGLDAAPLAPVESPEITTAAPGRGGLVPVHFRWRATPDEVGEHVFTLHARSETGLSTRVSFRVEVQPAPSAPRAGLSAIWLSRLASWLRTAGFDV